MPLRLLALALVGCTLALPSRAAGAAEATGTYRLHGTARVAAGAAFDRTVDLHADALVERGDGDWPLVLTVGAAGGRCRLVARLEGGGALALAPRQRCAVELAGPDARGHLDVVLRSGTGRLADDTLALELVGDVQGQLSVRTGGPVEVLGQRVDVPVTWSPAVPVQGEARARAAGGRDHSRASQPPGK